jgi:hypothetical protein
MLEENQYPGYKAETAASKTGSPKVTTTTTFRVCTEVLEDIYAKNYRLPVNCLPRLIYFHISFNITFKDEVLCKFYCLLIQVKKLYKRENPISGVVP